MTATSKKAAPGGMGAGGAESRARTPRPRTPRAAEPGTGEPGTAAPSPRPRRALAGPERQRDADRSRQALLDAALEEFSRRGFAGARVADIARRAGVNKQLINYYFGSKEGLYLALQRAWLEREESFAAPEVPLPDLMVRYLLDALADLINYYFGSKEGLYLALQRAWLEREESFAAPEVPLPDLMVRYLLDALADPRSLRLLLWRGLADDSAPDSRPDRQPDLDRVGRGQAASEVAADLDPAAVLLAGVGMVAAPIAMPPVARELFGVAPSR